MSQALSNVFKLKDIINVKDPAFGAKGDGVTNDSPAISAAAASLGALGGTIIIPNGFKCLIDTALTIPANVSIRGPHSIVGSPQDNSSAPYGNVGGALIINSSVTVTLKGSASLSGLLIYRKGMTFPQTNGTGYAGTAITIADDDAAVFNCMILGFALAITANGKQRPRLDNLNIDCLGGIELIDCKDIGKITRIHCWPFVSIAAAGGISKHHRSGNAFKIQTNGGWSKFTDCFSYGYSIGFFVSSANSITLLGCGADNTGVFAASRGFTCDGSTNDLRLIGCQAAAQDRGYNINVTDGNHVKLIGCDSWGSLDQGIHVNDGDVSIIGGSHRDQPYGIWINNNSDKVIIQGVRFKNISTRQIDARVATSLVHIGQNDYGDAAAGATVVGANFAPQSVASAEPLNLPPNGTMFRITGTTGFSTLNGGWAQRMVVLRFDNVLTVTDGASINLAGNFVTAANSTLTLIHNGTGWFEVSRSTN